MPALPYGYGVPSLCAKRPQGWRSLCRCLRNASDRPGDASRLQDRPHRPWSDSSGDGRCHCPWERQRKRPRTAAFRRRSQPASTPLPERRRIRLRGCANAAEACGIADALAQAPGTSRIERMRISRAHANGYGGKIDLRHGNSRFAADHVMSGRLNSVRQSAGLGLRCGPTTYHSHKSAAGVWPWASIQRMNSAHASGRPS